MNPEPGCYVDGHWGRYGTGRLIELAVEFGWQDPDALDFLNRSESSPPDFDDESYWFSLEAEQWLNENVKVPDHHWAWYDGEFFLAADMDAEDY